MKAGDKLRFNIRLGFCGTKGGGMGKPLIGQTWGNPQAISNPTVNMMINIEGSESIHSFHKNGTDKSLYVFEAPIDLLSHITLYPYGWLEHSYVACCGTSIQPVLERLRQNPKLDTVYLCLDNDNAGNEACDRMRDALEDMGLDVERLTPRHKDWNDDLCAKFEKHKEDAT